MKKLELRIRNVSYGDLSLWLKVYIDQLEKESVNDILYFEMCIALMACKLGTKQFDMVSKISHSLIKISHFLQTPNFNHPTTKPYHANLTTLGKVRFLIDKSLE